MLGSPSKFAFFKHLERSTLEAIDDEIRKEVLPFVKQFASLDPKIQNEAINEASTLPPTVYSFKLRSSWREHNRIAFLIDSHLGVALNTELSLDPTKDLLTRERELLEVAFYAENAKRVYSAGVKHALQRYWQESVSRYNLLPDDLMVLFTPWNGDFWTNYQRDHLRYVLGLRENPQLAEGLKGAVINKYHASEQAVFEGRLKKGFSHLFGQTTVGLQQLLDSYGGLDERRRENFVRGVYLTLERPDLRAIQEIVSYDNLEEYLFACNLYGIPDLFLRKLVISRLVGRGLVDERKGVLFYTREELVEGLGQMIAKLERQNGGIRKFDIFLQTRPTTCGVACMMMVMHHFLHGPSLNSSVEGRLRRKLRLRRIDIVPVTGLASYMKEKGLDVLVNHEDPERFWSFLRETNQDHYEQQVKAYDKAKKKGVIFTFSPITSGLIKAELNKRRLIIFGVTLEGNIKHAIVIHSYKDGKFETVDPLLGTRVFTEKALIATGKMDTGGWFVSVARTA